MSFQRRLLIIFTPLDNFIPNGVNQSWLSVSYYNFCWDHRSLRIKDESGSYQHRSPAMAAEITDHIWFMEELATYQVGIG